MEIKPNIWSHIRSLLFFIGLIAIVSATPITPVADNDEAVPFKVNVGESKVPVIKPDVILDIGNKTQRVIRLNPLDLPPLNYDPLGNKDSSLYKIQSLLPPHRSYVNSKRMRQSRPLGDLPKTTFKSRANDINGNTPHFKSINVEKYQKPKQRKKQLHFLYNQEDFNGNHIMKRLPVRFVYGAYPVYYIRSGVNGKFGKFPIKSFRNEADFEKYLVKSKLEPIDFAQRYET